MSNRILVATRKGLFTVERTGSGAVPWAITGADFLGDHVSMVFEDPRDKSALAALDHGHFGAKLHRRDTPESAWQEVAAPAYPGKPEGEVDNDPWGKPIPWTTLKIWALEAGGPDEKGVVWCGTIPGGLFRTLDGGRSWAMMRSLWDDPKRKEWFGGGADLPGIHSICVDPRDAGDVKIGISCGGVWRTRDGGATWACHGRGMYAAFMPPERKFDPNIQDAHRLVQCPAEPDVMWVQHHNGIFRSTDGGATWSDISMAGPSTFGFAVVVHPRSADTAWFVPAMSDERRIPVGGAFVVTRTRDGGKSFEALRDGLPQKHAYDLVFRHGLDIDGDGARLAVGSTTGRLWVSEDQGDSWMTIAEHLPPVYCVRFCAH